MSWNTIRKTIEAYLDANWDKNTTPIQWDNELPSVYTSEHIAPTIIEATSQRENLTGSPSTGHRFYGTFRMHIRTPADAGPGRAYALCDTLRGLFREKTLAAGTGQVQFEGEESITRDPDVVWFELMYDMPFTYDDF